MNTTQNSKTNIATINTRYSSTTRGTATGTVHCIESCITPVRDLHEIIEFSAPLDLKATQDPAPTTTCGRGLVSIEERRNKIKLSHRDLGRGRKQEGIQLRDRERVQLQKRDREIMRLCYEQQFLLSEQVLRFFFYKVGVRNGFQRLQELSQFGLIRWLKEPMLDKKRLIRLTRKGLRAITEDIIIEVPHVRKPDVRTLRHDSIVTSVRLRLQELWTGSWIPERVIKKEDFPRIPDGLFIFPSGKKVAVEVENTPKSRARFLSILEDWRKIDVKLVLYVATAPYMFGIIQRLLPDGPRGVPFALVLWEDLKNGTPAVWSVGGAVDIFSRKEY